MLLHTNSFNLFIADSVWNNILKAAGLDVESALFLSTRDLRDMFPEGGEINLDIKAPIVSAKHMNGRDCFVTDSVGLGIQNQAYLFSEVHIPALQVMKSAKWWGLELCSTINNLFILSNSCDMRKIFQTTRTHAYMRICV